MGRAVKLVQQHIAAHACRRHPPLSYAGNWESDCSSINHMLHACKDSAPFPPLSDSFLSIFSLSVSYFSPLFSFLSFFIDSLIENYIMFQPLSSQLMQPNNSFLFIFLMFISFVLLFYFLFLSFYFYFPLFLQSLVSIYLFSCTQSMFNNKLFVHILE